MKIEEELRLTQDIAYQTIKNGFLRDQKSHAYLISGTKGTPLKDTALFLAQSFVCENPSPLACEECITCERIKNGSYVDFQFINQDEGNITKDVIEQLQADFSLTGIEQKGIKIYIIHLIEKANAVAINRLLKFLEEPNEDIVGILTTENIAKVLPTIVSRCQVIRLKSLSKDKFIDDLVEMGLSKPDALILSSFNNSIDEVNEILKESDNYNRVKDLAFESFKMLFTEPLKIHYYIQREVSPFLKEREDLRLYLGILEIYLKEMLWNHLDDILEAPFEMNEIAKKNIKIDEAVKQVMLASGKIEYNVNTSLLLDQLYYQIALKGGLV